MTHKVGPNVSEVGQRHYRAIAHARRSATSESAMDCEAGGQNFDLNMLLQTPVGGALNSYAYLNPGTGKRKVFPNQ